MSKHLKHYLASNQLVTHALFVLYFQIQKNTGYTPIKKRNEILVKHLKMQQNKRVYSTLKKEIKTMLAIGRNPKGHLEARLHEVNQINLEYKAKFTHADELYLLFSQLQETLSFSFQLCEPENVIEDEMLYMDPLNINEGFDEQNNQVKPLSMTVKTHRLDALIHHVNADDAYAIEVVDVKDDIISLLLHRKREKEVQSKAS